MSGIFCDRDVCKDILRETALIMLESEERDENLAIRKPGIILVPTYMKKMIENPVVFSLEVKLVHWQDWGHSKLELVNKGLGNSFLCSATMSLTWGMKGQIILDRNQLIQESFPRWRDSMGQLKKNMPFCNHLRP